MFYKYYTKCVYRMVVSEIQLNKQKCLVHMFVFFGKAYKSAYFSIVLCAISSSVKLWPRPFVFRLMISGVLKCHENPRCSSEKRFANVRNC